MWQKLNHGNALQNVCKTSSENVVKAITARNTRSHYIHYMDYIFTSKKAYTTGDKYYCQ